MRLSVHRRVEQWLDSSSPAVELWLASGRMPVPARVLAQACCDWALTLARERDEIVGVVGRPDTSAYAAYLGALLAGKTPAFIPYSSERLGPDAYRARMGDLRRLLGQAVYVGAEGDLCGLEGVTVLREPSERARTPPPAPARPPRFIQCSSGTTGRQKAVLVTWPVLEAQLRAYAAAIELCADDRFITWLPMYHDMGLIANFLLPLLWGLPLHVLDPFEWARDPGRLLEIIERVGATLCFMPSFAYGLLARQRGGADLSSMRMFVNSGEPISHRAMSRFASRHRVPLSRMRACYGLAENVFAVTQCVDDRPPVYVDVDAEALTRGRVSLAGAGAATRRIVSCGVPLPGVDVEIDAAPGHVGPIRVRGPSRVDGYLDGARFPDEWLPTGDLGFIQDGHLFVCGRSKQVIIVGGRNLFPSDIEDAVDEAPGVAPGRCVALGLTTALDTESLLILAEPAGAPGVADSAALAGALRDLVEARFHVRPRVEIVPRRWLVKTTSGKLAREANLQRYQRARARAIHVVGDSTIRGLGHRYANLRAYWVGVLWAGELDKYLPRIDALLAGAGPEDVLVIATGEPECRVALPAAADPDAYLAEARAAYARFFAHLQRRFAGRLAMMTGIPTNAVTVGPSAPDPRDWPAHGWLPPIGSPQRRYQLQRRLYAEMRSLCDELGLVFIDACTPLLSGEDHMQLRRLDADGIHLDFESQQILCDLLHARLGFLGEPVTRLTRVWDGTRAGFEQLLGDELHEMAGGDVPLDAIFSSGRLGSLSLVELVSFLADTFGASVDLMEDLVSERYDSAERIYRDFIATAERAPRPERALLPSYESFLAHFATHYAPQLGHRRHTFRRTFEELERVAGRDPLIVETGTADLSQRGYVASGCSTLMFDAFVRHHGGRFHSVDVSPRPASRARALLSQRTRLWCADSVEFLASLPEDEPIDLLYLDSVDIDWDDPHPCALHHARELCAALPRLRPGALVVVDDNDHHQVGKAGYIHDLMERLGARKLFDHYQIGWRMPDRIAPLRAWGNHTPAEREAARALADQGWFHYERVGHDVRVLELLPGGMIGVGASRCEQLWFVQEREGGALELVLAGHGRITCRLRHEHGAWRGRWRIFEKMPVRLRPSPPMASAAVAEKLVGQARYRYIRQELDERVLELGPAGNIAHGAAAKERVWALIRDGEGELALELLGDAGPTCRLHPAGDGRWSGAWLDHERAAVELRPLAAQTSAEIHACARLSTARPVFLEIEGDTHCLRLGARGDVEAGDQVGAQTWRTELVDGVVELRLASAGRDTFVLRSDGQGRWCGAHADGRAAVLTPWAAPSRDVSALLEVRYRYVREGHDERPLVFGRDGWIHIGSSRCERAWQLVETDRSPSLELWGAVGRTASFAAHDRRWLGRWEIGERMAARLEPLPLPGPLGNWTVMELFTQRLFIYRRDGHDERVLELCRDQSIGRGRGRCEQMWRVDVVDAQVELVLSGAGADTCRLRRQSDGVWTGRWRIHEQMPVSLSPIDMTAI